MIYAFFFGFNFVIKSYRNSRCWIMPLLSNIQIFTFRLLGSTSVSVLVMSARIWSIFGRWPAEPRNWRASSPSDCPCSGPILAGRRQTDFGCRSVPERQNRLRAEKQKKKHKHLAKMHLINHPEKCKTMHLKLNKTKKKNISPKCSNNRFTFWKYNCIII